MKLELDENLCRSPFEQCRIAGHDTSSIHLQKLEGFSDATVHEVCGSERLVLVTLDLDFANPLAFDPRDSAGCAVLRLARNAGPADVAASIKSLR